MGKWEAGTNPQVLSTLLSLQLCGHGLKQMSQMDIGPGDAEG